MEDEEIGIRCSADAEQRGGETPKLSETGVNLCIALSAPPLLLIDFAKKSIWFHTQIQILMIIQILIQILENTNTTTNTTCELPFISTATDWRTAYKSIRFRIQIQLQKQIQIQIQIK